MGFGFGSKEIIMTRPFGNNARVADANGDNLGDLQVNADSNSENTGSVSCEHLVNADNYYCLNKTDIFTLLAFDDGSTPTGSINNNKAAKYDDVHFMANSPYLNLYSAEKLVSDRADYDVSDLFRQHMRGLPASTGLNRITTDISTNWASSLIGATNYTYSEINGCTILQTNMTCAADQTLTGKAPQVGDIVKSNTVTTKGVYIVAASGESLPVSYTLSDSFTVETAETISFYRHPQFQIYKFTPAPASTLPSAPTEEPVIELVDYATALLDTALTLVKHRTLSLFKFGYTLSILTHGMLTDVTLIFLCVTKPEVVSL